MLSCKRSKFTLPPGDTYLNCAYMSPLLKTAERAGVRGIKLKRNHGTIAPEQFFTESELLRAAFANTVNVNDPARIALIPSVSYGMATVAKNIKLNKENNIIVAAEQFPSNYYCWKSLCQESGAELKTVSPPTSMNNRGSAWNQRILEAITPQTKVVAIGNVHWADGTKFDLHAIRNRTKDVGALLIIDGTQSVGALPLDVNALRPDALVCAGYKWLLGPYSIGFAYYSEHFDNGIPLEENWINRLNSENFSGLVNYEENYQKGSLRYEVGEHSNFILVPMMLDALQKINRWGIQNIQDYCQSISEKSILRLQENNFWVESADFRSHHLFGIRIPSNQNIQMIKEKLLKKKIYVSYRGDAIRVSPNVYNREEDLEKLVNVLLSK